MAPDAPSRYTHTAMGLHWLMALMIFASFGLGLYMVELSLSPTKLKFYAWHKWAGVTIFMLVLVRCLWRLTHRVPPLPDHMPVWQRRGVAFSHALLYALMIAIPLSGWLMSSAKGFQTVYFAVIPIPDPLAKDKALGDLLVSIHYALNITMICMVAGHAAAALKHHFIDHDDILRRMLPARKKLPSTP